MGSSLSEHDIREFRDRVWDFYLQNGRNFPWREDCRPYYVLVSEIMLQQTQAPRVVSKFREFIHTFPDMDALANAAQADVLRCWQGLGYNRRARYLHQAARQLIERYGGSVPTDVALLERLPGVGAATARSLAVFAYNQPHVFIETNIRSVYLHKFFTGQEQVSDRALYPFVEATLDVNNPRLWYWALMDYGVYLKKTTSNPSRRSAHYIQQARFVGSRRQLRGQIVRLLGGGSYEYDQLLAQLQDDRSRAVINDLLCEGLIERRGDYLQLSE